MEHLAEKKTVSGNIRQCWDKN